MPASFTFEQAAAIPEAWMTAYQAIIHIADLQEGETCLIHAGASGIGTCLIQLAKMAKAKQIIVTAGTDAKIQYCKGLGATDGINYKSQDWAEKVKELTGGRGVDVIIDFVAGNYFKVCLAVGGARGFF
jgi:NADPH:quinone reductase-like Zn-dependent oxidoreductase